MGRTRKEESPVDATRQLDAKSKAIEKAKARTAREATRKSYKEDSESDSDVEKYIEQPDDHEFSGGDPSPSESGSDWAGESSGSEYGKKKSAAKGRGRGRKPSTSPKKGKGRGRGRPAAKGRGAAARNGSKKAPAPKRRREDSDESEESEAESSGSEYGKKASPKKRGSTSRGSPAKKRATSSPAAEDAGRRSRGRGASSKSYKEVSEDDFSEEEEVKPAPKAKAAQKPAAKKKPAKAKEESEEEDNDQFSDAVSGSEEEEKEKVDKKEKKNANSKPKESAKAAESSGNKSQKNGDSKDSKEEKANAKEKDIESDNESKKSDDSVKSAGSAKAPTKPEGEGNALKNRTDTDYSAIDFKCEKKSPSGDLPNLRIASWNVGGIKAFVKKNGLEYIKNESPDILCLQEIRCNDKTKPEEVQKIDGYPHLYWSFADQAGHHGVAIFSKTEPVNVINGLPAVDDDSDDDKSAKEKFGKEGRLITAEYEKFYLINAYVPNSGPKEKTDKDPKGYPPKINSGERQKFDDFLRKYIKKLEEKKPVILTGDLNVSHKEIDLANPKTNERTAGFTKEEREDMTKLLEETTLIDSFRTLYPDQKGAYTFWTYLHNARQKNVGWRLDYFLISSKLRDSLCENLMRTDVYGSDHCPIVLFLNV